MKILVSIGMDDVVLSLCTNMDQCSLVWLVCINMDGLGFLTFVPVWVLHQNDVILLVFISFLTGFLESELGEETIKFKGKQANGKDWCKTNEYRVDVIWY